ncbi:hypothetical protein BC830DRAFT_1141908 [Chytriomyces sp. MP71]|nr:hypothetical protein BC830DRAFT_1141908 [Chytriomyces sp. MP71]
MACGGLDTKRPKNRAIDQVNASHYTMSTGVMRKKHADNGYSKEKPVSGAAMLAATLVSREGGLVEADGDDNEDDECSHLGAFADFHLSNKVYSSRTCATLVISCLTLVTHHYRRQQNLFLSSAPVSKTRLATLLAARLQVGQGACHPVPSRNILPTLPLLSPNDPSLSLKHMDSFMR